MLAVVAAPLFAVSPLPSMLLAVEDAAVEDHVLDARIAVLAQRLGEGASIEAVRGIVGDVQRSDDALATMVDGGIVVRHPVLMCKIADRAVVAGIAVGKFLGDVIDQSHQALGEPIAVVAFPHHDHPRLLQSL